MAKNRLGKGLGAILSDTEGGMDSRKSIVNLYLKNIEPNPFQPRSNFDDESLGELAKSIKNNGVIQPITVRKAKPGKFQLVTGERRWRAARLAGLNQIPAIMSDYSDYQMMEIALIENLQREDLNPIEEAQAYNRMIDEFNMTQEEVANKVGKSRSSVANAVRLLNLTPKVQIYVSRETISSGHARALLALEENELQIKVADHIIKNHLSVRETEKYVTSIKERGVVKEKEKRQVLELDHRWLEAKKTLTDVLGLNIKIRNKKNNKKVIAMECDNYSDLEKIIKLIKK